MRAGDHLFFTDWRGDADERLRDAGPTVGELFGDAARRGVVVKGLMWRSHSGRAVLQRAGEPAARRRDRATRAARCCSTSGCASAGSHHQKLVVLRGPDDPERDVAFVGGIDLCHRRRDDAAHRGDPQALPMARRYGEHPPWHDVQLEVRGPAVGRAGHRLPRAVGRPAPAGPAQPDRLARERPARRGPDRRTRCPPSRPTRPPAGPHAVQVLRTYPRSRPAATRSPRTASAAVARGYTKVLGAGAAAGLPRGPVPVVAAHRRACSPRRCAATRSCT